MPEELPANGFSGFRWGVNVGGLTGRRRREGDRSQADFRILRYSVAGFF
jgi:hypothetical protein